jgi:hypothetical protein
MELLCPSEASVNFYQNTRRHILDDITRHRRRYENLKFNRMY